MNCYFDSCAKAVDHAIENRSFGLFYSERREPNKDIHIHECCELVLCLEGGKRFLIDNNVYDISDGDLFVINQFEAHKITAAQDGRFVRYILQIHPTFVYSSSTEEVDLGECFYNFENGMHNRLHLSADEIEELIGLFEQLKTEYEYGDSFRKRLTAIMILYTVNRMSATHSERLQLPTRHRTVQLAIDYINNNYSQQLTLDTISKNAYVSVNQLGKLFKKYCNITVSKYILSKRITEAKKLLAEGKSVTDTAFMCGFNDYANFIRVFKKTVGTPPGKYRSNAINPLNND